MPSGPYMAATNSLTMPSEYIAADGGGGAAPPVLNRPMRGRGIPDTNATPRASRTRAAAARTSEADTCTGTAFTAGAVAAAAAAATPAIGVVVRAVDSADGNTTDAPDPAVLAAALRRPKINGAAAGATVTTRCSAAAAAAAAAAAPVWRGSGALAARVLSGLPPLLPLPAADTVITRSAWPAASQAAALRSLYT
jgi:hypothetical protein